MTTAERTAEVARNVGEKTVGLARTINRNRTIITRAAFFALVAAGATISMPSPNVQASSDLRSATTTSTKEYRSDNRNGNDNDDPNSEASNEGNTHKRLRQENKREKGQEKKEKEARQQQLEEDTRRSEEMKIAQCAKDLQKEFPSDEIVPGRIRVIARKGVSVEELAAIIASENLEPRDDRWNHSIFVAILAGYGKTGREYESSCRMMLLHEAKVGRAEPYLKRETPGAKMNNDQTLYGQRTRIEDSLNDLKNQNKNAQLAALKVLTLPWEKRISL